MYLAREDRYSSMPYRRCGRSGIQLPALSLGLWHNFGGVDTLTNSRAIILRAFDLGITHFDLANNYGPPPGSAESTFGQVLASDLGVYRDELIISTKAGYDMWPGPYGEWGSRKYLLASLDQSLRRMNLDYVDIFYSHRYDPETPLDETMGALDAAVRQGKALYAGISSYSAAHTEAAAEIMAGLGTPILIHQPSYSMLNRWIEGGLLDVLDEEGIGCIVFSPLAQGMLSDRYLKGVPEGSRAHQRGSLTPEMLSEETLAKIRGLNEVAARRGQSLAQMALAWALRDRRVTSALIGEQRRPARREPRRPRAAELQRHRARRHRPAGDRERHQPLGGVQPGLTRCRPRPPDGRPRPAAWSLTAHRTLAGATDSGAPSMAGAGRGPTALVSAMTRGVGVGQPADDGIPGRPVVPRPGGHGDRGGIRRGDELDDPGPDVGGLVRPSFGLLSSLLGALLTGSLLLLAGFLSLVVGARRRSTGFSGQPPQAIRLLSALLRRNRVENSSKIVLDIGHPIGYGNLGC